jgi:hypothetical protein
MEFPKASETTHFIVNQEDGSEQERLSLTLTPPAATNSDWFTTYHTDTGSKRTTKMNRQMVLHSTTRKMSDSAPNLRQFLIDRLRDFDAGRWTPSAGEFRFISLFESECFGESKGGFSNPDHSLGIGVTAISGEDFSYSSDYYGWGMFERHELKPVVVIGNFLLSDDGVRRMTEGLQISPELACRMFGELPTIMKKFEEGALKKKTMNYPKTR